MGTASEASTSLQGVACNMAILAGATGCKRPKSGFWPTVRQVLKLTEPPECFARLTVLQESKTDPTVSFINRPLQTAYRRNGVHELVLGPKLSIGDLGLPVD